MSKFNTVLSSPLGFPGMTIQYDEIPFPNDLRGCTSYVGHPATKALVEALGAETIQGKYNGPGKGEGFLAVPLASNPRTDGYTQHAAVASVAELRAILCTRVK